MTKFISIAILLFLMYRLIMNGGKFLKTNNDPRQNQSQSGEFVDYEEVDSKTNKRS
ncbi:MAG: hypothetical protein P8M34_14030 [Saprospiraceae bacterium]|nr:hypothetical protein [Saprospiraceae bacterium]